MKIEEKFKAARQSKCISIRKMEELTGVGTQAIQHFEKGKNTSREVMEKLLDAVGLELCAMKKATPK